MPFTKDMPTGMGCSNPLLFGGISSVKTGVFDDVGLLLLSYSFR